MQILGREVTAARYANLPLYNILVHQKEGDCRLEREPLYKCLENCEKQFMIARYAGTIPISVKFLVYEELKVSDRLPVLKRIKDLSGLERVAGLPGYRLVDDKKGKRLFYGNNLVATYNPCGLAMDVTLLGQEARATSIELNQRIKEVHAIAESKPLDAILEDRALAANLFNPALLQMIGTMCGWHEGERMVRELMAMQARKN